MSIWIKHMVCIYCLLASLVWTILFLFFFSFSFHVYHQRFLKCGSGRKMGRRSASCGLFRVLLWIDKETKSPTWFHQENLRNPQAVYWRITSYYHFVFLCFPPVFRWNSVVSSLFWTCVTFPWFCRCLKKTNKQNNEKKKARLRPVERECVRTQPLASLWRSERDEHVLAAIVPEHTLWLSEADGLSEWNTQDCDEHTHTQKKILCLIIWNDLLIWAFFFFF